MNNLMVKVLIDTVSDNTFIEKHTFWMTIAIVNAIILLIKPLLLQASQNDTILLLNSTLKSTET